MSILTRILRHFFVKLKQSCECFGSRFPVNTLGCSDHDKSIQYRALTCSSFCLIVIAMNFYPILRESFGPYGQLIHCLGLSVRIGIFSLLLVALRAKVGTSIYNLYFSLKYTGVLTYCCEVRSSWVSDSCTRSFLLVLYGYHIICHYCNA